MKRFLLILTLAVCPFFADSFAQTNREARINYVLQNLGIKRDVQKKLRPLVAAYLEEKKKANYEYDSLKDKLRAKIDLETISNSQADQLLAAKWDSEAKELVLKRKYDKEFRTVLPSKKIYKCFDLLNDKKSKIRGQRKSDSLE